MDQKLIVQFDVKKGDNLYSFSFPYGNIPVGELYDAVFEMLKKIQELSNEAVAKAERKPDTQSTSDSAA